MVYNIKQEDLLSFGNKINRINIKVICQKNMKKTWGIYLIAKKENKVYNGSILHTEGIGKWIAKSTR